MGSYDIPTDIVEHVTQLQLIDSVVNTNNDISVIGYLIFDSKYE